LAVNRRQSAVNICQERSSPPAKPDACPATCVSPHAGGGGCYSDAAWRSTHCAPATLPPQPLGMLANQPGRLGASCLNALPPLPRQDPQPRGSVVRGAPRRENPTCPRPPPAVCAADFTALYDYCLANGLKARIVISHAAGIQVLTVTCSIPAPTETAAAPAGGLASPPSRIPSPPSPPEIASPPAKRTSKLLRD
jgi:hypothetical protein